MNTNKEQKLDDGLYEIDGQVFYELSEKDFYPPSDNRCYMSNIMGAQDDCEWFEYCEWFWEEYGYELYDDEDLNI